MLSAWPLVTLLVLLLPLAAPAEDSVPAAAPPTGAIEVIESDDELRIESDVLSAIVRKKGYVSGLAAGSFVDKRTGARDVGFGLHIMDFLLAPGWRDDGYERDPKLHGNLPKHYVEGPQICTQARELPVEVIRGDRFVAVRMSFTFHKPGAGYQAGSTWQQTIVFQPGLRYVLSAERITSVNDVDDLFYRIDMPGHLRHGGDFGETFERIYLSYLDRPLAASEFQENLGPDEHFFYQRRDGHVPQRMIRAYQVKLPDRSGPWLAGMTLDPAAVSEAWCHQRGYVCFIQELHRRPVTAGESFGAAYVVGWFDDIAEMEHVYDRYKGTSALEIEEGRLTLVGRRESSYRGE